MSGGLLSDLRAVVAVAAALAAAFRRPAATARTAAAQRRRLQVAQVACRRAPMVARARRAPHRPRPAAVSTPRGGGGGGASAGSGCATAPRRRPSSEASSPRTRSWIPRCRSSGRRRVSVTRRGRGGVSHCACAIGCAARRLPRVASGRNSKRRARSRVPVHDCGVRVCAGRGCRCPGLVQVWPRMPAWASWKSDDPCYLNDGLRVNKIVVQFAPIVIVPDKRSP